MADDVFRIILDRNIRHFSVSVTDQTGHAVNLSTFGTLLAGDMYCASEGWTRLIPRRFSAMRYRFSLTFEQDPQGVEALRKMTLPLTVVCMIFREDGGTDEYKLADAWVDLIEGRTIVFWSTNMKQSRT